jgi:glycosyltransferase involved in cell wall biosynthesis
MSRPQEGPPVRISVLTTAYQRGETLPRLYQSLAGQTLREFEWVVVDDGSTDGTGDLVRGFRDRAGFPIDYSRQRNQGRHVALNRAVERARGELCAVIDSDDWYMPEALERMLARWEEIPLERRDEFADVEGLRVDPGGELVCDRYPSDVFDTNAFELLALHGVLGDKIGMHRRDVLLRFPFPEDLGWYVTPDLVWNRIAAHYSTRCVNEIWAYTDYRPGGLSDRKNELRLRFLRSQLAYWREYAGMRRPMRRKSRLRAHANYVRYSLLDRAGPRRLLAASPDRRWTVLALAPGLFLYLRDRLWLARNRELVEAWSP